MRNVIEISYISATNYKKKQSLQNMIHDDAFQIY